MDHGPRLGSLVETRTELRYLLEKKALLFLTDVLAQVPEVPCRRTFTATSFVFTRSCPSVENPL